MKKIKNIYHVVAIILFIVGLFFSYLIGELDDAPGFIIFGTAITAFFSLCLFGLGTLIELTKKNNQMIENIYNEIKNKDK